MLRKPRVLARLSSILLLALAAGACGSGRTISSKDKLVDCEPLAAPRQGGNFYVSLSKGDAARLTGLQPIRSYDYGSFVWLELSPTDYEALHATSIPFQKDNDSYTITRWGYKFDPLAGEPSLPQNLITPVNQDNPGLYFIQFYGRLNDQRRELLQASGIQFTGSSSGQASIVWMSMAQAQAVQTCDFVRWVGSYHAAYRIDPQLRQHSGMIKNVAVAFYVGTDTEIVVKSTLMAIQSLGGVLLGEQPEDYERTVWLAEFALPAEAVTAVAQLTPVLRISYVLPEPVLEAPASPQAYFDMDIHLEASQTTLRVGESISIMMTLTNTGNVVADLEACTLRGLQDNGTTPQIPEEPLIEVLPASIPFLPGENFRPGESRVCRFTLRGLRAGSLLLEGLMSGKAYFGEESSSQTTVNASGPPITIQITP